MALILLDRAKETTIVLGTTASAILLGATPGYQSLAGVGNGNTTYYCIADQAGGLNWEVGLGTYTLATTIITRAATPLSSSNAGASVSFPAGTKDVFIVYPSSKGVWLDGSGNAIGLGTPAVLVGTNITGTATAFTASNVTTNANLTGAVTSVGNASSLGSFTSLQLLTALTDETGTGANVFATSPTLVTPLLGTPTSGTLTNCTFPTLNQNTTGSSASCTGNSATATSLSTIVGSAPSYACRAWVNFNGTGTVAIRASGNVSSITDIGTGDYMVNFTTAMPDADYSAVGSCGSAGGNDEFTLTTNYNAAPTISTTRIGTHRSNSGLATDLAWISFSVFR